MQNSPLQLEGYYIEDIAVSVLPAFQENVKLELHGGFHPSAIDVDASIPYTVSVKVDYARNDEEPLRYKLKVTIESDNDASPHLRYSFRLVMVGFMHVLETYPSDKIDLLVAVNGPALLYSSAREIIASITGRGPFPAIVLPSVNFLRKVPTEADLSPKKEDSKP
jgi:preprotein translocase subunit SecB